MKVVRWVFSFILTACACNYGISQKSNSVEIRWGEWKILDTAADTGQDVLTTSKYKDIYGKQRTLKEFLGKPILIDVWATWCSPCWKEFPFLKELHTKYHSKIEFLSISVDKPDDIVKWQKMVKSKALPGTHLLVDKGMGSEFVKKVDIKQLPRYILLDRKGRPVTLDAPKPSNEQLETVIKKHLSNGKN